MCRTGCPATFGLSARSSAHGRRWRTPPPAPNTPDWIINSSVQIEDVSKEDEEEEEEEEGLCEEDRLEIQAEMNRVKRPRMSD